MKNEVKEISYAYPTSYNAKKAGKSRTGCFCVNTGRHAKPVHFKAGFDTLEEAQQYADTLPQPFETLFGKTFNGDYYK
jgi:hypothetical protein